MILFLKGHDFHYETENLCRVFFPYEKIVTQYEAAQDKSVGEICAHIAETDEGISYFVSYEKDGIKEKAETAGAFADEKERERMLSVLLYTVLQKVTGIKPAWGILTGIHPVKLFRTFCADENDA